MYSVVSNLHVTAGGGGGDSSFRFSSPGPAPNSQGDLIVGDGAGGFAVAPLPPATPAHAVLLAGPPAPSPSTRLQWAPLTVTSAGTGAGTVSLVANATAPSFSLRGLSAGPGMTVTDDVLSGNVVIDAAVPGPLVDATLGLVAGASGLSLVTTGTGPDLKIRGILAGAGITTAVSGDTKDIIISTTAATTTPVTELTYGAAPVLPGASSYKLVVPPTPASGSVELRYFTDDTSSAGGIVWTQSSNYITGKATLTGVTLGHAGVAPGTVSLVNDGAGPSLTVKGIAAGATGITLAGSTATDVIVAANFTVGSAGGGPISLVATTATPGAPALKTLVAGPNVTITDAGGGNLVTIDKTLGGTYALPVHGALWHNTPSLTSVTTSPGVGTINMPNVTSWREVTTYNDFSVSGGAAIAGTTGQAIAYPQAGTQMLVFYSMTARAVDLTGGMAAGVERGIASGIIEPATVRQSLLSDGILQLECSAVVPSAIENYTLLVKSLGGRGAITVLSVVFGIVGLFP